MVLTVCNQKGGTGKTTSVVSIGAALGLTGFKVLLIDLDPQGFLSNAVGATRTSQGTSALDLFEEGARLDALGHVPFDAFDVLPASPELVQLTHSLDSIMDLTRVRQTLADSNTHDVILIDSAAAKSVYLLNALVASDAVLIPVTPQYQAVVGAEESWRTVRHVRRRLNPALKSAMFLITQVDGRLRTHVTYRKYLRNAYGRFVMKQIIRTSSALVGPFTNGRSVFHTNVHSRGARDYANATDELIKRMRLQPSATG